MGFFYSLMLSGVKPENELEEALLALLKEKIDLDAFINALVRSSIFLMTKGEADQLTTDAAFVPLMLTGADGRGAVAVFTAPSRAKSMQSSAKEFRSGLQLTFCAMVGSAPPGVGMMLNPGTIFSTEVAPEGFDDLRLRCG